MLLWQKLAGLRRPHRGDGCVACEPTFVVLELTKAFEIRPGDVKRKEASPHSLEEEKKFSGSEKMLQSIRS